MARGDSVAAGAAAPEELAGVTAAAAGAPAAGAGTTAAGAGAPALCARAPCARETASAAAQQAIARIVTPCPRRRRCAATRSSSSTVNESKPVPSVICRPLKNSVGVEIDAGVEPLLLLPLDRLVELPGIDVLDHLVSVEAELLRIGLEVRVLEPILLREEHLVHRPELAVRARVLGGAGRLHRARMPGQREVLGAEPDLALHLLEQLVQRLHRVRAVRALVVAVLDEDHHRRPGLAGERAVVAAQRLAVLLGKRAVVLVEEELHLRIGVALQDQHGGQLGHPRRVLVLDVGAEAGGERRLAAGVVDGVAGDVVEDAALVVGEPGEIGAGHQLARLVFRERARAVGQGGQRGAADEQGREQRGAEREVRARRAIIVVSRRRVLGGRARTAVERRRGP